MKRSSAAILCLVSACLGFGLGLQLGEADRKPAPAYGEDASARLTEILRLPDANERATALAAFFAHVASPDDATALREVFDSERAHVDEMAEVLLVTWWAAFDPEAALDGRIPPHYGGRDHWVQAVVREWTRRDPQAGLRAVVERVPKPVHQVGLRTLIETWFEHDDLDPAPLVELIEGLDDDVRARGEAIDLMLRAMLDARGSQATLAFAEALPEENLEQRREFIGRLAGRLSATDPDAAVALAERYGENDRYRGVVYRYLANQWGWADGAAAMEWAASLDPALSEQAGTVRRAWLTFARRDREKARAWMRAQEPSPGLEPAYARFVGNLARQDPEEALELMRNVESEVERNLILTNVGIHKMGTDPEAARAWMEAENLPQDVRDKIIEKTTRRAHLQKAAGAP